MVDLRASHLSSSLKGHEKFNTRSAGANEPRPSDRTPLRHSRSQPDLLATHDYPHRDELFSSGHKPGKHTPRPSPAGLSGSETARASSIELSPIDRDDRSDVKNPEPVVSEAPQTISNPSSAHSTTSPSSDIRLEGIGVIQVVDQSISNRGHADHSTVTRQHESEADVEDTNFKKPEKSMVAGEQEVKDKTSSPNVDVGLVASPRQYSEAPKPCDPVMINPPMLDPILPHHSDTEHRLQYDDVDTSNDFSEDQDFAAFRYAQMARCVENRRVEDVSTDEIRGNDGRIERPDSRVGVVVEEQALSPINAATELTKPCDRSPRCDSSVQSRRSSKKRLSSHSISSHPSLGSRELNPEQPSNPLADREQNATSPRSCPSPRSSNGFERSSTPLRSPHDKPLSPPSRGAWHLPSPVASFSHHPAISLHPLSSSVLLDPSSPSPFEHHPPSPTFPRDRCSGESEGCFDDTLPRSPFGPHPPPNLHHSEPRPILENHHRSDALPEKYRERMLAFLELDQNYHSRTRQLRMRLVEVEEEHERRRREMLDQLGLSDMTRGNPGGSGARVTVQVPNHDHRSRPSSSRLVRESNPIQASPMRFGVPQTTTPGRSVLGSTVAGRPVTPRSRGAQVELGGGLSSHSRDDRPPTSDLRSRSTCSHLAGGPNSTQASPMRFCAPSHLMTPGKSTLGLKEVVQHLTPRSVGGRVELGDLDDCRLSDHPSALHLNVGIDLNDSGRVGLTSSSGGGGGQAEIALQGIAAILKLTNSSSLTS